MKTKLDNLIDEIRRGKPGPDTVAAEMRSPFRDEFEPPVDGWMAERKQFAPIDDSIMVYGVKISPSVVHSAMVDRKPDFKGLELIDLTYPDYDKDSLLEYIGDEMCRCHLVPIEEPPEDTDTDTGKDRDDLLLEAIRDIPPEWKCTDTDTSTDTDTGTGQYAKSMMRRHEKRTTYKMAEYYCNESLDRAVPLRNMTNIIQKGKKS